jgi:DNA-binding CsgD family transcriptional regulator/PAS domain-containing protein
MNRSRIAEDVTLDLLDSIYAAAADAALWPQVVQKLSNILDIGVTSICCRDPSNNPSSESAVRTLLDLLQHYDTCDHDLYGCSVRDRFQSAKPLARQSKGDRQNDSEVLGKLGSHLERALQIDRRISRLRAEAEVLHCLLDSVTTGIIVTNASAEVLEINRASTRILSARDGMFLDGKRIRLTCRDQNAEFQRVLKSVSSPDDGQQSCRMLSVSRPSLRRPYSVAVVPPKLATSGSLFPHSATAVVFVTDPDAGFVTDPCSFESLFGFTKAESRLADALVAGLSLNEISEQNRLTVNTLKTQLKNVFRKTNTSRQAELVLLLTQALAQSTPKKE